MLEMRPGCECCDSDLPTSSKEVMICSFECTFCHTCATEKLAGSCPNCGGQLTARPTRDEALLKDFPAKTERTFNPDCCK